MSLAATSYEPRQRYRRRPSPVATIEEAAEYCRLSTKTIRRFVACGKLRGNRVGKRILITFAALDRLIGAGPGEAGA